MKQHQENGAFLVTIPVTILGITALHYFSVTTNWHLHDFYKWLYYFPIIIAAFRFKLRGGFFAALAVGVLYAPHMFFYFGHFSLEVLNQFLDIFMFLVVGLTIGYLAEKDQQKRDLLESQLVQIADLEDYTSNILDNLGHGVIALNARLEIESINLKAQQLFSSPAGIKKMLAAYKLTGDLEEIASGRRTEMKREVLHETGDQEQRALHFQGYPLKNRSAEVEGVVLLVEDVTQLKSLEQQLKRSERLSAIGQFASGIAHEIRNPLAIMKTISQTLSPELDGAELKEGLEIIQQEIERANGVIKGLFDYARPTPQAWQRFSCKQVVEDSIQVLKTVAEQQRVILKALLAEEGWMLGSPDRLKQAVINLMLNGIQAMESGGVLSLELSPGGNGRLQLLIRDQGSGIPQEILANVFDPFFTTKEKGIGLGLAVTHRIIEEHQGTIEINSQGGEGTTVKLDLPLVEKESEPDEKAVGSR